MILAYIEEKAVLKKIKTVRRVTRKFVFHCQQKMTIHMQKAIGDLKKGNIHSFLKIN